MRLDGEDRYVIVSCCYCYHYSLQRNKNRTDDLQRCIERRLELLNETVTALRNEVMTYYVTLHIVCSNNGSSFTPCSYLNISTISRVAFRERRRGAFAPLKLGCPLWAMLCVLLLIIYLTLIQIL